MAFPICVDCSLGRRVGAPRAHVAGVEVVEPEAVRAQHRDERAHVGAVLGDADVDLPAKIATATIWQITSNCRAPKKSSIYSR